MLAAPAAAQELPNGGVVSSAIVVAGEQDLYTFVASSGEGIQIRCADLSGGPFRPRLVVQDPNGTVIADANGLDVTPVALSAPMSGTYTVTVSHYVFNGLVATGAYNLYFTRAPGANELGPLPNGGVVSETLDLGDLDSYTFSANAGEGIAIRCADLAAGNLRPDVAVYGPTGSLVTETNALDVAALAFAAPSAGIYTVVVTHYIFNGIVATGPYNLYFTRAPGANELGTLVNGAVRNETLDLGDLDSYTFTAKAGSAIQIQCTDLNGGSLRPEAVAYGPTGALVGDTNGLDVATLGFTAAATGRYTVVITHYIFNGLVATGPYSIVATGIDAAAAAVPALGSQQLALAAGILLLLGLTLSRPRRTSKR